MCRIAISKSDVIDNSIKPLLDYAEGIGVSEEQLFCIVDKYLYPEDSETEESFSTLIINQSNESIKSIKLCNGFFNVKEAFMDIFSICNDTSQVLNNILEHNIGFKLVFLIIKIITTLYRISEVSFGFNEYFIIMMAIKKEPHSIEVDELINAYHNLADNKLDTDMSKNIIMSSIDNLKRYHCVEEIAGNINIVERIHFKKS